MKRLIVGCGYVGSRVARIWLERGDEVFAVTRRPGGLAKLERHGLHAIVAEVTDPPTLAGLPNVDSVVYAVGYDRSGAASIEDVYAGGVRNVLSALAENPGSFVYVSTTGVYPDALGEWIDESTPPCPTREGGRASLAAEDVLRASAIASRVAILRMAGLYGPGRIPFLEKLRAGEPIPAAGDGWLNLVHVDDAAAAVVAVDAWMHARGPAEVCVLNVSDGQPVRRSEYYAEVARQIGAPSPRLEPPDPTSHRAARASTNRRIRNTAMLRDLNLALTYPSHREGLKASLLE